jgi:hypothetical protein
MEDQGIVIRTPAVDRDIYLLVSVHNGSEAHPLSYQMGIGRYFAVGKAARA